MYADRHRLLTTDRTDGEQTDDGVDGWCPLPFRDFGSLPWKVFSALAPRFLKAVCGSPILPPEMRDNESSTPQNRSQARQCHEGSLRDQRLAWKAVPPESAWEQHHLKYRYINSITLHASGKIPFSSTHQKLLPRARDKPPLFVST